MCVFIIVTCVDHGKFIRLEGDYEEKIIYSGSSGIGVEA